jgi:cytochrome c-type biogenesis protein
MDLIFGYLAGLLTLVNPCVLPVLPIVLATALQAHPLGPVALAAGMSASFVALGLGLTALGNSLGLSTETVASAGAVLMIAFGLILLVPRAASGFALATGGVATRADAGLDRVDRSGLGGQLLGGAILGAVWSPCVGPTLGGAIALASQGQNLPWAASVMAAFAAGVSTIILALGYGARAALQRRRTLMRRVAQVSKPVMGAVFLAVGLMILTGLHHRLEAWAVDALPYWLTDFSVSI